MKPSNRFQKLIWRSTFVGAVACALAFAGHGVLRAHANPTNSPSARAAIRLKYYPPNNWIRHYLGDDRYKIAGNVWKVVSTQMDTYYHRPNCPNMLRQPAGIVIGFPGAGAAEEGGYIPDPYCSPRSGAVQYSANRGNETTVNRSRRSQLIVLADGKSTVLLPPNWKRTRTGAQTIFGYSLLADTLQPLKGGGYLRFSFVNAPGGINVEPMLTPDKFSSLIQTAKTAGRLDAEAQKYADTAKVSSAKLGGKSGVSLKPASGGGSTSIVANGSKVYILENKSGSAANASTVTKSFQPR